MHGKTRRVTVVEAEVRVNRDGYGEAFDKNVEFAQLQKCVRGRFCERHKYPRDYHPVLGE